MSAQVINYRLSECKRIREEAGYVPPFMSTPCIAVESYSDQDNGYACGEPSAICPKCGDNAEVCSRHLTDGMCVECAEVQ